MERLRLQKYLSDRKIMSRRAAEREIAAGKIFVNGLPAQIGQHIDPAADTVTYPGGQLLPGQNVPDGPAGRTYILLNKPVGYVTTLSDEQGRPCIAQLIRRVPERVYPVGRLDMYSDGLLLLTNDGALTQCLTHPRHQIPKIYRVELCGEISDDRLAELREPMTLDGYQIRPVAIQLESRSSESTTVRMTLWEGRNRQIRKMCAQLQIKIHHLTRIAMGELSLGTLPPGKWRHLTEEECAYLMNIKNQFFADRKEDSSKA